MDPNYYKAIRKASRANLQRYYTPSSELQRTMRRASPTTAEKLHKEHQAKARYLALANSDRRARELANFIAKNRNINHVRKSIKTYTQTYNAAKYQGWANNNKRTYSFFPYAQTTLKKVIYHLKRHLERLEFAKFLAGRKVAELMMPRVRTHFFKTAAKN